MEASQPADPGRGTSHSDDIARLLDVGRTIDAGFAMTRAIRAGQANRVPRKLQVTVLEELINTRNLEDEKLLVQIAEYMKPDLPASERSRLYALANLRGKIDTSLVFI